jgi:hypothetical protein
MKSVFAFCCKHSSRFIRNISALVFTKPKLCLEPKSFHMILDSHWATDRLLSQNVRIRICRTIVLLVVLYRRENWFLTFREQHRLRVFKNRLLRRIFRRKRDDVIGCWRKLHNEELHNLFPSSSIIRMIKSRRMRWAGHVARMGEKRNACRILVGKPEGKRPLRRPRRRWEY